MKAILIDPFAQAVSEIELPLKDESVDIDAMLSAMNCGMFDVARLTLGDREIDCYVDDNGLFVRDQAFFLMAGRPLAGRALLLGHTAYGEAVDVPVAVDAVRAAVQWVNRRYAEAAIELQTQAAMAQAVAHGQHVESNGPYGFIATPFAIDRGTSRG